MASPVDFADKVGHRFSVSLGERAESVPERILERNAGAVTGNRDRALVARFGHRRSGHRFLPTMSSGRTSRSKSASLMAPSFTASSRKVVPCLCAALAIWAALS